MFKFSHDLKREMLFKLKWTERTGDMITYKVNESLKSEELNFVRPKGKEVIIKLLAIIQTSKKLNHKLDYTEDRYIHVVFLN